METKLHLGSVISITRVPLAVMFLVVFDPKNMGLVWLSILIAVAAQLLDHIDGWLARRVAGPSVEGWLFDSVSDRAFYIAAIMAFGREYGISEVIIWAFVLREICLYAVRITAGDFAKVLPQSRMLSLFHAALIRLAIAIGCLFPVLFQCWPESLFLIGAINALLGLSVVLGFLTLWWIIRS